MTYKTILFLLIALIVNSCNENNIIINKEINIIPKPLDIDIKVGEFVLDNQVKIIINTDNEIHNIANYLKENIKKITNPELEIAENQEGKQIYLKINKADTLGNEGYSLLVEGNKIVISSSGKNGIFYGVQSLMQLFFSSKTESGTFEIPNLKIIDKPKFKWRGMHLDVCRHFFPKEFVLKYIDMLAYHKMNVFHWHLTEDQGWRIEIKKYPKLHEIGSQRNETVIAKEWGTYDGVPYGGYYTQEDIKEIVKYAQQRYITIVPEIEMPGHSMAALASYPELGCTGGPYKVATTWGVFNDVYCAGNENTFEFLENVLSEVMQLFPSEYIHIGGDECPKKQWEQCEKCQNRIAKEGLKNEHELQAYFIRRMEKFINSKGRQIIGWDEILEGGLAPNASVMSWRGVEGGIEAANMNHNVVMSPGTHCYFDHFQDTVNEPLAIGGFTNLEKVYSYNPIPDELSADKRKYILGCQANLWTEYIATTDYAEYMALPRACALAEVCWLPKDKKNYDDFQKRMTKHYKFLELYGYNYCLP